MCIKGKRQDKAKGNTHEVKIVLLGAGECGKSTVVKQMRIRKAPFSEEERLAHIPNIRDSTLGYARRLLLAQEGQQELLIQVDADHHLIPTIWRDGKIKALVPGVFSQNEVTAVLHFLDNAERIFASEYVPTDDDILRERAQTNGIKTYNVDIGHGQTLTITDLGGQRSKRRLWIHALAEARMIIFVANLCDYDLQLAEDPDSNRMIESIRLFRDIYQSAQLSHIDIMLFLNKSDLFREKIKTIPLNTVYPEFTKGSDYEASWQYILRRFTQHPGVVRTGGVYPHVTCATDCNNMATVLDSLNDVVLTYLGNETGFNI